ncbi:conserved hypothetical protein [Erythrobacter sp. HL-111]|nr:MAG: hypothetical protein HLUCCO15_13665 [Erythrobacteraceae bacterium HL-111]SDT08131.1 conserved hypothetical protein [Erythrobacter sp. HL-111]
MPIVRTATRAGMERPARPEGRKPAGRRRAFTWSIPAAFAALAAAPAGASGSESPVAEVPREQDERAAPVLVAPARAPIGGEDGGWGAGGGEGRAASAISGGGLTVSANATIASAYRFRGIDLSGGDPALQGGIDIAHDSGFYAGTFATTIDDDTTGYGGFELDLYAGWSGDVAEGLDANLGVIAYTFPDAPAGDFDYVELYGSLGFTLGPARAVVGGAWDVGRDGLAFGGVRRDNLYLYTDLSAGVPGTPVTVNAHLGYTDGAVDFAGENVSLDWSLGADWAIRDTPLVLGVAYVDAADDVAPPGAFNPTSGTVLATLTAYF